MVERHPVSKGRPNDGRILEDGTEAKSRIGGGNDEESGDVVWEETMLMVVNQGINKNSKIK